MFTLRVDGASNSEYVAFQQVYGDLPLYLHLNQKANNDTATSLTKQVQLALEVIRLHGCYKD